MLVTTSIRKWAKSNFFFGILFAQFFFSFSVVSEVLEDQASFAPTNFDSRQTKNFAEDTSESLSETPGAHLKQSGGQGKVSTLSIRGSKANDLEVSLEGIRLNSVSNGEFDLGLLSGFGLEPARVIRGGYSPLSTYSSGQVLFTLPKDEKYRFTAGIGTEQSFLLAEETPFATLSIEQSENNFTYSDAAGKNRERTDNFFQRLNFRTWYRTSNTLALGQILYSDQEAPGPTFFPTPKATYQVLQPLIGFRHRWNQLQLAAWAQAQEQSAHYPSLSSDSENHWWSSGLRASHLFLLPHDSNLDMGLEWSQDYFRSKQKDVLLPTGFHTLRSPLRHTVVATVSSLIGIDANTILHPRLRAEFLSDLRSEHFSFHPGIGLRNRVNENVTFIWNLNYLSRAPNFNEMYFEIPQMAISNPHLKRQKSYQADIGYRLKTGRLQLEQSAFFHRTDKILQSMYNGSVYQVQNVGMGIAYGLENSVEWNPLQWFSWKLIYTLLHTSLKDHAQPYQPTHSVFSRPEIKFLRDFTFGVPFRYRSKVATPIRKNLNDQFDLGAELTYQRLPWKISARVKNLLFWQLIEVEGFPQANHPTAYLTASYEF